MGNGVISEDDLMSKLSAAKKIMNTNVKPTKKGVNNYVDYDDETPINENVVYSDPEGLLDTQQLVSVPRNTSATTSINRINESRLPENIKRAMIENPIVQPDISLTNSLDIKLVQKAKKLMDDGNPNKQIQESRQPVKQQSTNNININEIISAFTPIIENSIRKILDEKLTQILTAKDTASINENLVLKVGDSIFKGKITGVRPSK
jgi:hypothetical protein